METLDAHQDEAVPLPPKLDTIPSAVIGKCASYLRLKDYIHFGQANKAIYEGCYSPSTLQTLQGYEFELMIDNEVDINHSMFSSLVSLEIMDLHDFIDCIESHSSLPRLSKLRRLILLEFYVANQKNDIWQKFTDNKCIDFDQITTLYLQGSDEIYDEEDFFHFDALIDFLLQFKNVTHLTLRQIELRDFDETDDRLSQLLPNLIVFRSEGNEQSTASQLLQEYLLSKSSENLIGIESTFNREQKVNEEIAWKNTQYPRLKELMVSIDHADSIKMAMNNMSNLEKLWMVFTTTLTSKYYNNGIPLDDDLDFEKFLFAIFAKPNNLEYICFEFMRYKYKQNKLLCTLIINQIVSILSKSRDQLQKKELVIEFQHFPFAKYPVSTENSLIPSLMSALEKSGIDDFMVKLSSPAQWIDENDELVEERKEYMKYFEDTHLVYLMWHGYDSQMEDHQTETLIIANKSCKINGYMQQWMIDS